MLYARAYPDACTSPLSGPFVATAGLGFMASGMLAGAAGGFIGGAGVTWMRGGSFAEGFRAGMFGAAVGGLTGAVCGLVADSLTGFALVPQSNSLMAAGPPKDLYASLVTDSYVELPSYTTPSAGTSLVGTNTSTALTAAQLTTVRVIGGGSTLTSLLVGQSDLASNDYGDPGSAARRAELQSMLEQLSDGINNKIDSGEISVEQGNQLKQQLKIFYNLAGSSRNKNLIQLKKQLIDLANELGIEIKYVKEW